MNGLGEENWDSRSRLQNTSAQKCVNEEHQDRSREKKKKKHAALIRNAGGVLPVQSQRRKQAERHRRALCVVSFPLPFVAWNPPPIGGQLTTSSFVLSHFSLSLSLSRSLLARSGPRMRRSSRLSLYRTSRSMVVSGKETYQRARAKARLVGISNLCKS